METDDHRRDEELDAYEARLPREMAPPEELQRRTLAALRSRGLLGSRQPPVVWLARIAAAVLLFLSGAAANGYWDFVTPSSEPSSRELPPDPAEHAVNPCGSGEAAPARDEVPCSVIWF